MKGIRPPMSKENTLKRVESLKRHFDIIGRKITRPKHEGPEYKLWRANVFQRDGYKCQVCQEVGGTLNAHHIKKFSRFIDGRYDINNGITLCEDCHKLVHRLLNKYGLQDSPQSSDNIGSPK
jgi:5-methylcytosine-specific restriction endonuclease McrA